MPSITVQVWDATSKHRNEVELPDDAPINRILSVLVDRMNLPRYGPTGELLEYQFSDKASGKQLLGDHCLAEAGVRDGDALRLQPESTVASDGHVPFPAELEPILFRCACGRLTSAPRTSIGKRGKCSRCGRRLSVPPEPNTTPISPPSARRQFCGICQMVIGDAEPWVCCPKCDRRHHADCWDQYLGCNDQACREAGVLMPRPIVHNRKRTVAGSKSTEGVESADASTAKSTLDHAIEALCGAALFVTIAFLIFWLGDPDLLRQWKILRVIILVLKTLIKFK